MMLEAYNVLLHRVVCLYEALAACRRESSTIRPNISRNMRY